MENCLVTKLKATVDNNSLPRLNQFRFSVKYAEISSENQQKLIVKCNVASEIYIVGDGALALSIADLSLNRKTLQIPADTDTTIYFSVGNYDVFITNEYDISMLQVVEPGIFVFYDLKDFKYMRPYSVVLPFTDLYGDIAAFEDYTVLNNVQLYGNEQVTGDISHLYMVLEAWLQSTSVYGEVMDLVEKFADTIGSRRFVAKNLVGIKKVTLNNIPVDFGYITWDKSNVSSYKIACYDSISIESSSVVNVYGYTASEIAANTASGGIWYGKTVINCGNS